MQYKHLSLLALAGLVAAQDSNGTTPDLNAALAAIPELSTLASLVSADPALLSALGSAQDITILAPSNDAFSQLLNSSAGEGLTDNAELVAAILQYHVLNGTFMAEDITNTSAFVPTLLTNEMYTNVTGGQVVEAVVVGDQVVFYSGLLMNSTVTTADVTFTGGIIHIIDTVLTLPALVSSTALAANLTALYGALNATSLVTALDTTPDLTIFAPTNEAFASIASALQNASTEDIASILTYHVVNGTVGYSSGLENGTSLTTLNGAELTVTLDGEGGVWVNGAKVVVPNVLVGNGVVHVIDHVLNPSATEGPNPTATAGTPAYTGATSASDIPFTSGLPTPTTMIGEGPGAGAEQTASESSSMVMPTGAAAPMQTGAVGAAALFAGAVMMVGY